LTYGLLLTRKRYHEFHKLIQGLKDRGIYCQQPLLVAVLVADLVVNTIARLIEGSNRRLNVLEETMGQHEYVNRPKGNPLELKFEETTSRLNFIGRTLAVQRMRVGSTLRNLEKILQEAKDLSNEGENRPETSPPADLLRTLDDFRMINESVAYQTDACQNLLLRVGYQEKRTQLPIGVVRKACLRHRHSIAEEGRADFGNRIGIPIHGPKRLKSQYQTGRNFSTHRKRKQEG
jgi:hypothetical protein